MPITLRVVGIFYAAEIDLKGDVTPKQVLDAAEAAPGDRASAFKYTDCESSTGFLSVTGFSATYTKTIESLASKNTYDPGVYSLYENLNSSPSYTVWQYYIADAEGRPKRSDKEFLSFANPKSLVPANGFLTWRLVSILRGNNPPARVMASRV